MTVKDIIIKVDIRGKQCALILANGYEFLVSKEQASGIVSGMSIEAEFCKNLMQKLYVNGQTVFTKSKENLLPEMDSLIKELAIEAENERRMKINLEANKKLINFMPLLKTRITILQSNDESFMRARDWRRELKIGEMTQNIYFAAKSKWGRMRPLNIDDLALLCPDIKKMEPSMQQSILLLTSSLTVDCLSGINPEDENSVKDKLLF